MSKTASRQMFMRPILIALLLLIISISPAFADKASVEDRQFMSASISNCMHDCEFGCSNPNPFKTTSVKIGAAVVIQYYFALADWKSTDGTKRGQAFLSTNGCQIWSVGPVSIGHALHPEELTAYISERLSGLRASKQVATKLVDELAQVEAQNVVYLRVPPGPSC
jgi:hypothetical protein